MDYLSFLVHEIHTAVVATVDDEGLPVTAAIDMMDCDENSLYFLTARGKSFYDRLKKAMLSCTDSDQRRRYPDECGCFPAWEGAGAGL